MFHVVPIVETVGPVTPRHNCLGIEDEAVASMPRWMNATKRPKTNCAVRDEVPGTGQFLTGMPKLELAVLEEHSIQRRCVYSCHPEAFHHRIEQGSRSD